MALAAFVFTTCSLCRAYVMLREVVLPDEPHLTPLKYLGIGVVVPDLLPTLAALLVLRRRPIACARCGEECGRDGCLVGGLGCLGFAVAWARGGWPSRVWYTALDWLRCGCCFPREVSGIDRTPLRDAEVGGRARYLDDEP